jgi:hypothetical protein
MKAPQRTMENKNAANINLSDQTIDPFFWLVLVSLTLLALGYQLFSQPLAIATDCAVYLHCAQLLRQGQIPYIDFFDINPPLIIYLNGAVAAIAQLTAFHIIVVFKLLVLASILLSTAASAALMWPQKQHPQAHLFGPLLFAFCLFNLLVVEDFGQREHLLSIAVFPFLLCRWLRYDDRRISALLCSAIGLAAGVGLCLKPQFIISILATEIVWLIATRRFRALLAPEVIAAVAFALAYAAAFWFGLNSAATAYFSRWVPIIAAGYSFYGVPITSLLLLSAASGVLPLLILASAGAVPLRRSYFLVTGLLVWSWLSYALYVLGKGAWFYHAIPALLGGILLGSVELFILACWCVQFMPMKTRVLRMLLACALSSAALLVPSIMFIRPGIARWNGLFQTNDELTQIVEQKSRPGDKVLFLSKSLSYAYPRLVQLDRAPGSRYLSLFPLSMLDYAQKHSTGEARARWEQEEERMIDELGDDIHRLRPTLIFIEQPFAERKLARYDFKKHHLANYQDLGRRSVFQLYRRIDAP